MITEIPGDTGPKATGSAQPKNTEGDSECTSWFDPVAAFETGLCEIIFVEDRDFVEKPQLIL